MTSEEKLLPHDVEAEEAVLGSILIDETVLSQLDLTPSDFFTQQGKWIFESMVNMTGAIDQITVAHDLANKGRLDEIGGAAYLRQLVAQAVTSVNADYYAKIVKDCSLNRKLIQSANKIEALGFDNGDPQKSFDSAKNILNNVFNELPVKESLDARELAKRTNEFYGSLRTNSPGLLTGIWKLDEKIGGLLPGESVCLSANTSVGKTSLAVQIMRNVSKNKPVLFASEEMTAQDIVNKMVAQISGVSSRLIILGNYPDERLYKLCDTLPEISDLKFRVIKCRTTSGLRIQVERYQPSLIIVDYLQKLRDRPDDKQYQRVGYIAHELTSIAKEYEVPLIALAQLHRAMEDTKNKKPRLGDIRDSGEIEESFDMVWGLWRDSYSAFLDGRTPESWNTELWILKNRLRGNVGKINIDWDKEHECYR